MELYIFVGILHVLKFEFLKCRILENVEPMLTAFYRFLLILLVSSADYFCKQFGPKLGPNFLTPLWYFWKNFSKKVDFEQNQLMTKKHDVELIEIKLQMPVYRFIQDFKSV